METPAVAIVAVSGGPDSLTLLDLLAGAAQPPLTLVVAHADHGILEGSAAVAAAVRDVAVGRYGLEVVTRALHLGTLASETRAREARYTFLRDVQRSHGARYLVTAHHADDQAETVLLRLLRGSAPAGLAGIPARGPHGLVRPLLPFTRAELRAHAVARDLPFVDDPSNADPRHTRAWVRHQLMPLLSARLGGEGVAALRQVARHARDDVAAWDALLDRLDGLDLRAGEGRFDVARSPLGGYDAPLAGRLLRAVARRSGLRLAPGAAARLAAFARDAASGRRLELGGGLFAEAAFDRLVVGPGTAAGVAPARLDGEMGMAAAGNLRLTWRPEKAPALVPRGGWTTWVEPGTLEVRALEPGDRVQPVGGFGHRPVRRLLMEARVPRVERAGWPLLVRDGAIIWVPGICRTSGAVPAPGTLATRIDAQHG